MTVESGDGATVVEVGAQQRGLALFGEHRPRRVAQRVLFVGGLKSRF